MPSLPTDLSFRNCAATTPLICRRLVATVIKAKPSLLIMTDRCQVGNEGEMGRNHRGSRFSGQGCQMGESSVSRLQLPFSYRCRSEKGEAAGVTAERSPNAYCCIHGA